MRSKDMAARLGALVIADITSGLRQRPCALLSDQLLCLGELRSLDAVRCSELLSHEQLQIDAVPWR